MIKQINPLSFIIPAFFGLGLFFVSFSQSSCAKNEDSLYYRIPNIDDLTKAKIRFRVTVDQKTLSDVVLGAYGLNDTLVKSDSLSILLYYKDTSGVYVTENFQVPLTKMIGSVVTSMETSKSLYGVPGTSYYVYKIKTVDESNLGRFVVPLYATPKVIYVSTVCIKNETQAALSDPGILTFDMPTDVEEIRYVDLTMTYVDDLTKYNEYGYDSGDLLGMGWEN